MVELKAVDLFAGCGGGSIGLQEAGAQVVGAVDIDDAAIETYRSNPVDVVPMKADLTEIDFIDIADHYGFESEEIDLIMGCPPCQNFSSLRDTKPWPQDEPKDELLKSFYQHVREVLPDFVIFENVPGITSTDGGQYLDWLLKRMNELGYGKALKLVDAADYGVPQHRKRAIALFALGKSDAEVSIIGATHAPPKIAENNGQNRHVTVRDAINDLPPLEAGEKWDQDPAHRSRNHRKTTLEIIKAVPKNGGSRMDIQDDNLILDCHKKLKNSSSAGNVYGRMSWDKPAPTLTTRCTVPSCGRFIHPTQHRGITFREAARLMGFPDFELPEKNKDAERVVGNAVPPRLISTIASPLT